MYNEETGSFLYFSCINARSEPHTLSNLDKTLADFSLANGNISKSVIFIKQIIPYSIELMEIRLVYNDNTEGTVAINTNWTINDNVTRITLRD